MGFLKKFKSEMKSAFGDDAPSYPAAQQQQSQMPMTDQPASLQEPSPLDVLRYRYQHGTNFGSIFVLEKWLTGRRTSAIRTWIGSQTKPIVCCPFYGSQLTIF